MIHVEQKIAQEHLVKTGTTTVGIVCRDGVILASDRRASAGYLVADKEAQKIHQIAPHMAVTIAGLVSDAQLLVKLIKAEIRLKDLTTLRKSSVKEAANLLASIQYRNIRMPSMVPGIVGFLLAGVDEAGNQLYEIGVDGSISLTDKFMSDGSGSPFALGVLETQYKKGMSLAEGKELAVKSVNAALQRDIATGNGLQVWAITKEKVEILMDLSINTGVQ
ncbi:proteasome subunit beta [Candidatus Woesearchaeota archaeon]|nr:proteasome subunit beta [Candidatus Woesearchaeota archaeon]